MFARGKTVQEGDLVLVWVSRTVIRPVVVRGGEAMQTKFGQILHADLVGQRYGAQVRTSSGKGFVHVVAPSPELWALSLPHRTQIVYSPDASYIAHRLRVRPGSAVIEAGTGSGAFTHALARTVGAAGRVHTYEYHAERHAQAQAEFAAHGMARVACTHRNVCDAGFDADGAHAVFLDLPAPWAAIPHLARPGVLDRARAAHVCCFSPCIEQVTKTVLALSEHGFQGIETVENQARRWEGHAAMVRSVGDALGVLRDVRRRRALGIDRRRRKRLASQLADAEQTDEQRALLAGRFDHPEVFNPWGKGERVKEGDPKYAWEPVSTIEPEVKSHTSYLTFAFLPCAADADSAGVESADADIADAESAEVNSADAESADAEIADAEPVNDGVADAEDLNTQKGEAQASPEESEMQV